MKIILFKSVFNSYSNSILLIYIQAKLKELETFKVQNFNNLCFIYFDNLD